MAIQLDDLYLDGILRIDDMDCPDCAAKVEQAIRKMPGIAEANLTFSTAKLQFKYDPSLTGMSQVVGKIHSLGYTAREAIGLQPSGESGQKTIIRLEGLDCADCAAKLEKRIQALPGVDSARVNYGAAKLEVNHQVPVNTVLGVIEKMGYKGRVEGETGLEVLSRPFWRSNKYVLSTLISGSLVLLALLSQFINTPVLWTHSLYILAIILGGFLPAKAGLAILINAHEMDMNVLMIIAALGAVALGQFEEGAVVVVLFSLGNALQAYSMDKTRNSIRMLMELAPHEALVWRNGQEMILSVQEIKLGDILIIRPGERIAMDGQVLKGASAVDEKAITGESMPMDKEPGYKVYAGTVNGYGSLEVEVQKLARDNTINRIISLVEDAQGQKAPAEQFVDKFARYYTPGVIITAILVAFIPPILGQQSLSHWVYQALGMLLVACPCALVISTPVSIVSAIGSAARNGVLIKGGAYLEALGDLRAIAFDKTGTLTQGQAEVTDIIALNGSPTEVLRVAAAIESRSEHPLAEAICRYGQQQGLSLPDIENFQAVAGQGAYADLQDQRYFIGNVRFFKEQERILPNEVQQRLEELQNQGKTVMLLADAQQFLGLIAAADRLRNDSSRELARLKQIGIEKTIMLTGDNQRTARSIAAVVGVDEYQADLLPEDKVRVMKELLARHEQVAMVGDGVNDAPALAIATVGIAMGAAGTDVALETADIALMSDDLSKLAYSIDLGRRTRRIIKQNIAFSLFIKLGILLLVIPGWLTLWLAVAGDMGTSLLVTLNGMRLLKTRN